MGDTKEVAVMSHPSLLLSSSSLLARLTMTSSRRDIPEKKEKKRKEIETPTYTEETGEVQLRKLFASLPGSAWRIGNPVSLFLFLQFR